MLDYLPHHSRREYLDALSEETGVDRSTVYMLAAMLGPSEDCDGLVTALEDYAQEAE